MEPERKNAPPGREIGQDWEELRRRLAAARLTLHREPTPARTRAILNARAAALARETGEEEPDAGRCEVLEFRLASETYAIETACVRATSPLRELTPLPGTPAFLLGLINLRGQILSVIDLKRFFDLPEKGLTDLNRVIIVHGEEMEFGLLADEILGVRSLRRDEIQPPLPTLTGIREEYLLGVSRERTVVLNGRKLLTDPALVVNDEE
jgi:purine-binding chemotaxis protein CheW